MASQALSQATAVLVLATEPSDPKFLVLQIDLIDLIAC